MVDYTSEKMKHLVIGSVIAVVALALVSTGLLGSVTSEGLEIKDTSLKKGTSTDTILTVTVKNVGNSPITNVLGSVSGLPSGAYSFVVTAGTIAVGDITSFSATIPSSSTLSPGQSYPVLVNATTAQGNTVSSSAVVYVSRL